MYAHSLNFTQSYTRAYSQLKTKQSERRNKTMSDWILVLSCAYRCCSLFVIVAFPTGISFFIFVVVCKNNKNTAQPMKPTKKVMPKMHTKPLVAF